MVPHHHHPHYHDDGPYKNEPGYHCPSDTRTITSDSCAKTASITAGSGSSVSVYEVAVPGSSGASYNVDSHSHHHFSARAEDHSYHYPDDYHHRPRQNERDYHPRGRSEDDRWDTTGPHRPPSPRRREISPAPAMQRGVQKTYSSKSHSSARGCFDSPRRKVSPSPPLRGSPQSQYHRSRSPKPTLNPQDSSRSIGSFAQKKSSLAELASVTRPDDESFVGAANASWVSRGNDSFRNFADSFRGAGREQHEEVIIQQQFNTSFSSHNGDQEVFVSQSNSFRSIVRENSHNSPRSPNEQPTQEFSSVLNNSFRRLNDSFQAASQHNSFRSQDRGFHGSHHGEGIHSSPHNSFRGHRREDMSGLLDQSLTGDDQEFYPGAYDRDCDRDYAPHESHSFRNAHNSHTSLRGSSHNRSFHREDNHSSHRSFGGHHSSHNSFYDEDAQAYDDPRLHPSRGVSPNNSFRSQGRPMYNRENSWKNEANETQWRHRFEHNRPQYDREGSFRNARPSRESSNKSHGCLGYHPESSFDGRDRPGMYQRESSFRSQQGRPEEAPGNQGRPRYEREPSLTSRNKPAYDGRYVHDIHSHNNSWTSNNMSRGAQQQTALNYNPYEEGHTTSAYSRSSRQSKLTSRYNPAAASERRLPPRSKSDCGVRKSTLVEPNHSCHTNDEKGFQYGREDAMPGCGHDSSFSSFTSFTQEVNFESHSVTRQARVTRKLPSRSKSNFDGFNKRAPARLKDDTKYMVDLSKGFSSVANTYSTRGGDEGGILVEITPGVEVPLRRACETQDAVSNNFYTAVSCMACANMDLYAIADVAYFVCPSCKTMCSVDEKSFNGRPIERHGLGLGFTSETLFCMQSELSGCSGPARAS